MRLLMIDDSDFKIERIQNELQKIKTVITLDVAKYRNKGLRMLYENDYDGLVLDIQFPILSDGDVDSKSGIFVLKQMKHNNIIIPTVIFSSACTDVSESGFEISDYIINGGFDISSQISSFIDKCENYRKTKERYISAPSGKRIYIDDCFEEKKDHPKEKEPRHIGMGKSVPASFSILQHYFNSIYSESDTKFYDIERLLPGINFSDIQYCDMSNTRVLWFGDDVHVPVIDSIEQLFVGTNTYWAAKQIFKSEKQNRYLDYFTGLDLYTHQQYLYDKNSYTRKIEPIVGLYGYLSSNIIWIDYNCYFDEKHDTVKLRRRQDEVFKNIRYRKDGDFIYTSYDSVTGYHILRIMNTKDHNSIFCITKEIKEKKHALASLMETLGIYPYEINWGDIPHKSRVDLIIEDINRESKNNRKARQAHRGKGDN